MPLKLPLFALAPAKLNLCLYVGGRRPDGLHEICSLFQSVSLADEVRMEKGNDNDEVICPGVPEPNLALAALERFREAVGLDEPAIRIIIKKNVPIAAGLGGGSADAAAVLRMCAALRGLDPGELASLAMSLGADVPSQLAPGTALVTGAGEHVEPLHSLDRLEAVLLTGQGSLRTGEVYAHAGELAVTRAGLEGLAERLRDAVGELRDPLALGPLLVNDLQPAAVALEPEARTAIELLREAGAVARVSGSGPAAFGLFERGEAEQARASLEESWPGLVIVVEAAGPDYAGVRSPATAT